MITSGSQNQLQSSLAPLGDLLKAFMFLSNSNSFNSSPSPLVQGFNQRKGSSKVWKEKSSKWWCHFFSLLFLFLFALLECFALLFWISLALCFALFNMFLFVFSFFFLFCFSYKNKIWKIRKIQKQCVMCTLVLMYLGWPLKQSFLNFVSFVS